MKIDDIPEEFDRKEDFVKAVKEFIREEEFVLKNNLNERTISNKLSEYLQKYFRDYNVDCEYNRMPDTDDPKEYVKKTLELDSENDLPPKKWTQRRVWY